MEARYYPAVSVFLEPSLPRAEADKMTDALKARLQVWLKEQGLIGSVEVIK